MQVGLAVGSRLEAAVGLAVGLVVGLGLGLVVGLVVGLPVGLAVGAAVVGLAVGAGVEPPLGLTVGTTVVGLAVGAVVGPPVGLAVGEVGAAVSDTVHRSIAKHRTPDGCCDPPALWLTSARWSWQLLVPTGRSRRSNTSTAVQTGSAAHAAWHSCSPGSSSLR